MTDNTPLDENDAQPQLDAADEPIDPEAQAPDMGPDEPGSNDGDAWLDSTRARIEMRTEVWLTGQTKSKKDYWGVVCPGGSKAYTFDLAISKKLLSAVSGKKTVEVTVEPTAKPKEFTIKSVK